MSLRTRLIVYIGLLHVALAVCLVMVLQEWWWMLLAEGVLILSVLVAVRLVATLFVPFQLVRTGADLILEGDFTCTFKEVGHPEMDRFIQVYNTMIERLREERLKAEERHAFLSQILDASSTGVITLDLDGHLAELNPAAALFLGAEGQGRSNSCSPPVTVARRLCLLRGGNRLGLVEVVVFPEGLSMTARFSQARNSRGPRGKHSQTAVDSGKAAIDHHEAGLRPPQTPPNHHLAANQLGAPSFGAPGWRT